MEHEHSPQRRPVPPSRRRRCIRAAAAPCTKLAAFSLGLRGGHGPDDHGILWLLPRAHALIAGPEVFEASQYDGSAYTLDLADARLTLVNANLPLADTTAPSLAVADDATGVQLDAEAAQNYRTMAAAAQQQGVTLTLEAGYQDTADEYATGYGADILSADSHREDRRLCQKPRLPVADRLCGRVRLCGALGRKIGRRPTGMAYAPWHWRYVGKENALALRASGLSLEEFLALGQLSGTND